MVNLKLQPRNISEFTYPGKKLGVIEEFVGGRGVYYGENGDLRSKYCGFAEKNLSERVVEVREVKKAKKIKVGDEVIGRISEVSGVYGTVKIEVVNGKLIGNVISAVLYPTRHLKRGEEQYKVGDVIYGVVDSLMNRIVHISIENRKYGVILAQCSRCGSHLKMKEGELTCVKCRNRERRKISEYYDTVDRIVDLK